MPRKVKPQPDIDRPDELSVAGEEDPGAALDEQPPTTAAHDQPSAAHPRPPAARSLAPGDEAAAGTPGTGETVCDRCGGRGTLSGGARCPLCGGSGKLIHGIGGG